MLRKKITSILLGLLGFGLCAGSAPAAILDLGPNFGSILTTGIANFGDRNVVIDADANFSISSAGIRIDPLAGGANALRVEIHAVSPTGGAGTRGALLAFADAAIVDTGLGFYDVPINFDFVAGQRYDIAFLPVPPQVWGVNPAINVMELYIGFEYSINPNQAFSVGGVLTVIDGGQSENGVLDGTGGGYPSNGALPHIRLTTATASAVPEPGTLALLAAGLVAIRGATRRKQKRRQTD